MTSDETLLSMPAAMAVRRIAIGNLDRAAQAAERFRISEDPESLHDFRVGLRRLRATVRGYRERLDGVVPKKLRRALREMAEASTLARDTEVQLGWLQGRHDSLRQSERAGYRWLHRHWQAQLLTEYLQLHERIDSEFAGLDRRLRSRLEAPIETDDDAQAMEEVVAESLGQLLPVFADSLNSLAESMDSQLIHPPRLIGKRLRYQIDPFSREIENARELSKALGKLQDLLGDIHDRQVLQPALLKAAEAAGSARYRLMIESALHADADPQTRVSARRNSEAAGLVALARLAQQEEHNLMDELRRWIASGAPDTLVQRLHLLQEELGIPQTLAPPPIIEIS
jgi:CHAD domain-containing protein